MAVDDLPLTVLTTVDVGDAQGVRLEGLGQAHGKRLWSGWRGSYGWVSYDRIGDHGGFHPTLKKVEGMRWPPGRGWTVVAMVIVGLSVLVVAGRMLAPSLGEPLVISTAPTPTGTIRIVPLTEQPSDPPPMTWSTVPATPSGKPGQLTGGGVRLRLPGGWHGRTTSEGGTLILQAANFLLATQDRDEDPVMAMTQEEVMVTLSTGTGCCPGTRVSASPAIGASDFVHGGRVPVGRALAEKVVRKHGSILHISALFGGRSPAPSLLRQTNQLLASLTVT